MNDTPPTTPAATKAASSKTTKTAAPANVLGKLGLILALILLLLIPLAMINGVMEERKQRSEQVSSEVATSWAGEQVVQGPLLTLPTSHGKYSNSMILLPEKLTVTGSLKPNVRHRGIYNTTVYQGKLHVSGQFNLNELEQKGYSRKEVNWNQAHVTLGISDIKGIQKEPVLTWQNTTVRFNPGINPSDTTAFDKGMQARVPLTSSASVIPFEFDLDLNGSKTLSFLPVGKDNNFSIKAPWASPSFTGNFLPTQHSVNDQGFNAHWTISYFARSFPQVWMRSGEDYNFKGMLTQSQFGVSLISTVDFYQQCTRAVKYGVLFLVLSFVTVFLFEMLIKAKIHPFQYILVGCSLCLFYLLLISLAEIVGFLWAYILAALPTITMIALYTQSITQHTAKPMGRLMALLLGVLYTYLYILLQLEDYSLLMGSVGLFAVLGGIMFISRQIDWYNDKQSKTD